MFESSNPEVKESQESNQDTAQEEQKPLFSGVDSQGKERLFSTAEEAQESWQNAQNFIKDKVGETKTLEARIQELEAQLNQSTKLEDALNQLKQKEESPVTEQSQQQTTETTPQAETSSLTGVDVEQLKQQLTQEIMGSLTQAQQQEVYSKNQTESIEAAKAVFGDAYESKLRESAQELGMSDEEIIQEAQSNPKRFKKLFGLDKQQSKSYTPSGSVNTGGKQQDNALNFTGGFTDGQRIANAQDNYRKIAQKQGIKLPF